MAIATLNPSYPRLRGKVGGLVFKHYRDKVVVTRAPTFSGEWSAVQRAGRIRFANASAYARRVQADPLLREKYATIALQRGLTIRSAAISAYLKGESSKMEASRQPLQCPKCKHPKLRRNAPPLAVIPRRHREFGTSALMRRKASSGRGRRPRCLSYAQSRFLHSRRFVHSRGYREPD